MGRDCYTAVPVSARIQVCASNRKPEGVGAGDHQVSWPVSRYAGPAGNHSWIFVGRVGRYCSRGHVYSVCWRLTCLQPQPLWTQSQPTSIQITLSVAPELYLLPQSVGFVYSLSLLPYLLSGYVTSWLPAIDLCVVTFARRCPVGYEADQTGKGEEGFLISLEGTGKNVTPGMYMSGKEPQ